MTKRFGAWLARVGAAIRRAWDRIRGRRAVPQILQAPPRALLDAPPPSRPTIVDAEIVEPAGAWPDRPMAHGVAPQVAAADEATPELDGRVVEKLAEEREASAPVAAPEPMYAGSGAPPVAAISPERGEPEVTDAAPVVVESAAPVVVEPAVVEPKSDTAEAAPVTVESAAPVVVEPAVVEPESDTVESATPVVVEPAVVEPKSETETVEAAVVEPEFETAKATPIVVELAAEVVGERAVPEPESERAEAAPVVVEPAVVEPVVAAPAESDPPPTGEAAAGEGGPTAESLPEAAVAVEAAVAALDATVDAAVAEVSGEAPQQVSAAAPPRRAPAIEVPKDYVPAAESGHELYQLQLEQFEGPLDLLLLLIRRHKIDILDIPISFICERYLHYVKLMEDLNIDVAAEFLVMASELLHIKSKMLLPKPADIEEEEEVDPRAELVMRLLEYQKYKDAAEQLSGLEWLGRDVHGRAPEELPPANGDAPLREVGVFALIEAFDAMLASQKPEHRHQVRLEAVSVKQRMVAIVQHLGERDSSRFEELFGDVIGRIDVVVTFLAILEMTKMRLLSIYQSEERVLYLKPRFENPDAAMSRLAGLDLTYQG